MARIIQSKNEKVNYYSWPLCERFLAVRKGLLCENRFEEKFQQSTSQLVKKTSAVRRTDRPRGPYPQTPKRARAYHV